MISDQDMDELVKLFVDVANDTGALSDVTDDYQNRSLAIKIYDSAYNTGLMVARGKINMLRSLDRPTCTVSIDKETFWRLLNVDDNELQRIAIYKAFYTERTLQLSSSDGDTQIHAENLIKIFTNITRVMT